MRLGIPDIGLLTLAENAENAGRVAHASGLPVFADADTGYGNPLNVRRTIMEFERQGVAAVMIEDQITPKRCAMFAGKEVISCEEMEMKLKAGDPEQEYDALLNLKISAGKYDLKLKSEQQREWIIKLKRALTYWHDEANASLSVCAANELRIETELEAKAQLQRQIDRLQAELAVRNDSQFVPGRTNCESAHTDC